MGNLKLSNIAQRSAVDQLVHFGNIRIKNLEFLISDVLDIFSNSDDARKLFDYTQQEIDLLLIIINSEVSRKILFDKLIDENQDDWYNFNQPVDIRISKKTLLELANNTHQENQAQIHDYGSVVESPESDNLSTNPLYDIRLSCTVRKTKSPKKVFFDVYLIIDDSNFYVGYVDYENRGNNKLKFNNLPGSFEELSFFITTLINKDLTDAIVDFCSIYRNLYISDDLIDFDSKHYELGSKESTFVEGKFTFADIYGIKTQIFIGKTEDGIDEIHFNYTNNGYIYELDGKVDYLHIKTNDKYILSDDDRLKDMCHKILVKESGGSVMVAMNIWNKIKSTIKFEDSHTIGFLDFVGFDDVTDIQNESEILERIKSRYSDGTEGLDLLADIYWQNESTNGYINTSSIWLDDINLIEFERFGSFETLADGSINIIKSNETIFRMEIENYNYLNDTDRICLGIKNYIVDDKPMDEFYNDDEDDLINADFDWSDDNQSVSITINNDIVVECDIEWFGDDNINLDLVFGGFQSDDRAEEFWDNNWEKLQELAEKDYFESKLIQVGDYVTNGGGVRGFVIDIEDGTAQVKVDYDNGTIQNTYDSFYPINILSKIETHEYTDVPFPTQSEMQQQINIEVTLSEYAFNIQASENLQDFYNADDDEVDRDLVMINNIGLGVIVMQSPTGSVYADCTIHVGGDIFTVAKIVDNTFEWGNFSEVDEFVAEFDSVIEDNSAVKFMELFYSLCENNDVESDQIPNNSKFRVGDVVGNFTGLVGEVLEVEGFKDGDFTYVVEIREEYGEPLDEDDYYIVNWKESSMEHEGFVNDDDDYIKDAEVDINAIFNDVSANKFNYVHALEFNSYDEMISTYEQLVDNLTDEGYSLEQIAHFLNTMSIYYLGDDEMEESRIFDFNIDKFVLGNDDDSKEEDSEEEDSEDDIENQQLMYKKNYRQIR